MNRPHCMRSMGRKHFRSGDPRANSGLGGKRRARLVMFNVGKSKEHSKLSLRQQEILLSSQRALFGAGDGMGGVAAISQLRRVEGRVILHIQGTRGT